MRAAYGVTPAAVYELVHVCQACAVRLHINVIATTILRTAVLTHNLRSEGLQPDGKQVTVRWNSTTAYARIGGNWRMLHSHWSLTAPPCLRGIF
jgi:hypothetical protein